MNQGKLEVVKQEMTRLNINILGISELKWTGMGEFNSDDHQNDLNSNPRETNITVVQVYAPTTGAEEAEIDQFYEGLQHLVEITPKNDVRIIIGDWNAKVGSQKITGITGKISLGVQNEAGQRFERLKKLLIDFIHPDQNGFLPKRQMKNNLRTILDILEYYEIHTEKPMALLFLDDQKAFDNVNWQFMKQQMIQMEFGERFMNAISSIYQKQSARILINGELSNPIEIQKGTRQGCPLSPLLFILILEVLNRCVRVDEDIKGTRIRDGSYKLQAFADDLVFITEEPFLTMPKLLQRIEEYGEVTGMKIEKKRNLWEKLKLKLYNELPRWLSPMEAFVYPNVLNFEKIIRYGDMLDKDGGLKLEQEIQEQGLDISWRYKVEMQSRYAKDCKTWGFYRDLTEFDQVMLKTDEKIIKRLCDFLLDRKMEGEQVKETMITWAQNFGFNVELEKWQKLWERNIKRVAFRKCAECGSKMSPVDPHDLCLLCLSEGHRTDKCCHCLAFTKQAHKNRENCLRKLLWDQVLMQSDQLTAKSGPAPTPPAKRLASALATSSQHPATALTTPGQGPVATPPMPQPHPSDDGTSPSGAQRSLSPPCKQWEKRKHGRLDHSSSHKKVKKDKSAKPAHKPKRHWDSGSSAPSISMAVSVPTPSVPMLQVAMQVTPLGSLEQPASQQAAF
ncbi:Craniofacial development protein 2 [Varanus komodoensis]|nr:Craniofacial development protein 2 [Varanus komodoensis]